MARIQNAIEDHVVKLNQDKTLGDYQSDAMKHKVKLERDQRKE